MRPRRSCRPAVSSVPGRPSAGISTKPESEHADSGADAVEEIQQRDARARARGRTAGGCRRLISGNVVPSRIDCGQDQQRGEHPLRSATATRARTRRAAATRSAQSVDATNSGGRRARRRRSRPRRSRSRSSGWRMRCVQRPISHAPSAMPPMKTTRTSVCAYAAWPDEELEVVRPDRLVDQAADARDRKDDLQCNDSGAYAVRVGFTAVLGWPEGLCPFILTRHRCHETKAGRLRAPLYVHLPGVGPDFAGLLAEVGRQATLFDRPRRYAPT